MRRAPIWTLGKTILRRLDLQTPRGSRYNSRPIAHHHDATPLNPSRTSLAADPRAGLAAKLPTLIARLMIAVIAAAAVVPAQAATPPSVPLHREDAAADSGRQLVEMATRGQIDAAYALADTLRRPRDTELAAILQKQQQQLAATLPGRGTGGTVRLVDTAHFGETFVRWYYSVAYADGEQRWMLTFRNRSDGWFLNGVVTDWVPK